MRNSTINIKYGICSDCQDGKEKPLTANRCQTHYWQHRAEKTAWKKEKRGEMNAFLKRTPIKKVSKKQLENLKEYRKVRDEFMKQNRTCQARLQGCTVKATDLHHKKSRIGDLLTDTKFFMAVCRQCHNKIEDGGAWVYEQGLKIKRLTNN